jgi:hypothetical protein
MKSSLPSSRGDTTLIIDLGIPTEYKGESGFDASVEVTAMHWAYRGQYPCNVGVKGLWFRKADLMDLNVFIEKWLDLPLVELATTELVGKFELAKVPGDGFCLSFGRREGTISGIHPVISITIKTSALQVELYYVTDQSCLRLFSDELCGAIKKGSMIPLT